MKYKYIVWDWNGTIIDDASLSVSIFNKMCDFYGLQRITIQEYQNTFKIPVTDFYAERGFDFSKIDFHEIGEFYVKEYNETRFNCSLHDGVVDVMRALKSEGVGQSILSAYQQNHLRDSVAHFGLNEYMDNVFGLGDILAGSKEARAKALIDEIGVDPKSVLMVGDTTHDKAAADAMGADCAFVAKGHNAKYRLEELKVPVFDTHTELLDYVVR